MIRPGVRRFLVAVTAAATLGCASGGASSSASTDTAPKRDRTVITAEDMKDITGVSNLLEVVQRLHPEWLSPRNAGTAAAAKSRAGVSPTDVAVQVYIDLQHAGTADMLGQLSVTNTASIKYYSASEAQARFGNGNMYGAIQVVTVKR